MKDNGLMTKNMVMVNKPCLIQSYIQVSIEMVESKAMVISNGLMESTMKAILLMIKCMVKEKCLWLMGQSMKANGLMVISMA